jgi:hypothetical protein
MGAASERDDFDAYAIVQAKRDGRSIKRPKKIFCTTDDRGWITICNESERLCVDDKKALRVILIADLRAGHPELKPGLLGRTIPNSSDYYRYVGVHFDNGVTEVVSVTAIQPIEEAAAAASVKLVRAEIEGSMFDWDNEIAAKQLRDWEARNFLGRLDVSQIRRGGAGPHELYAYSFPSLVALAEARGTPHYPVKIGYTGAASEVSPSLTRIDGQLGDPTGRAEPAVILGVWQSWNGRAAETRVHSHLRGLQRKVPTAVGREWFYTCIEELEAIVRTVAVDRSGLALNGPVPDSFQGFRPPNRDLAESIQVICCRITSDGYAMIQPIEFDDLLEEATPPEVCETRGRRSTARPSKAPRRGPHGTAGR